MSRYRVASHAPIANLWLKVSATVGLIGCALAGSSQQIEWEVTILRSNMGFNRVLAVTDSVQAGFSKEGGQYGTNWASFWMGSTKTWTRLTTGEVHGAGGHQLSGFTYVYSKRASLWDWHENTFVNLNPTGYGSSMAYDTDGNEQAGYVVRGSSLAALWRGSAESFVNLHPDWAESSVAYSVSSGQQGGVVVTHEGAERAALWKGSAQSLVVLHPASADRSVVRSNANGTQAGYVIYGNPQHAALWQGTEESFVDVHPMGAYASQIVGTTGDFHVGWVRFSPDSESRRETLWIGEGQYVELNSVLNPRYISFRASSIHRAGNTLYIGGEAFNTDSPSLDGILLVGTIVPEPATLLALTPCLWIVKRYRRSS